MANKELDRKYAVKYIPKDLKLDKIINIKQSFIYHDKLTLVRLRKIATKCNDSGPKTEYIYTVKTQGDIDYTQNGNLATRYEIESHITEEEYSKLLNRQISNTIDKTRTVIELEGNLKAEMDIFHGYLEGLIVVEVEFEDEEHANKFEKPDWFGEEVGYQILSNRKLSEMTKEEFESKVDKDFMENNKKVLEELKNNIVINFFIF